MTKLKAFATHLGISLVIFLIILSIIVFYWYPPPFFSTDGGWQGIRIIAAVDLVLGPLLTLIVFRPGKPGLKFDLTVIGLVQAAALTWGIWVVHHERPVAAVFTEDKFSTLMAYKLNSQVKPKDLLKYGPYTPVWIFSDLPDDVDKLQKIRITALQTGKSLSQFHEYYRPIDKDASKIISRAAIDMEKFVSGNDKTTKIYQKFVKKHQYEKNNIIFLPWIARYKHMIVALRKNDMSYIGLLDISPPDSS